MKNFTKGLTLSFLVIFLMCCKKTAVEPTMEMLEKKRAEMLIKKQYEAMATKSFASIKNALSKSFRTVNGVILKNPNIILDQRFVKTKKASPKAISTLSGEEESEYITPEEADTEIDAIENIDFQSLQDTSFSLSVETGTYMERVFNMAKYYTASSTFCSGLDSVVTDVTNDTVISTDAKAILYYEIELVRSFAIDIDVNNYFYQTIFDPQIDPNSISKINTKIKTSSCTVTPRTILLGAVAAGFGGGIRGAVAGATTGTFTAPGVGTVTGAVSGFMIGFTVGFISGVIGGTAMELVATCLRYNIKKLDDSDWLLIDLMDRHDLIPEP